MTKLKISNENIYDIMKIVKFLEEPGLLLKDVRKTIKKWNKRTTRWISRHVIRVLWC